MVESLPSDDFINTINFSDRLIGYHMIVHCYYAYIPLHIICIQSDPLQKAMTAFASALGVSVTKLKFMFDGDPIQPTQTATDLDMEDDDCIDVAMIA